VAELSALESAIASLQGRSVQDPGKIYGGLLPFSRIDAEKLSGPETEGPLPSATLDASAGISGVGLDAATGILNLLKGAGGGFDRNDPQSAKTIAKSALDLFGGSQLLRKGPIDPNTLGMYLGPEGIKKILGKSGVERAARELENAPGEGGILRLNQGPNQYASVVVHPAPRNVQQYAKRNVNEKLQDIEAQRNARLLDNLSGPETDAADLQTLAQQKKILEQLPATKIMGELSDEVALFSKKATRSIDDFLERANPAGDVARSKEAGYKVSLSPEEEASRVTTLGKMMGHPQLFETYPELINLKVRFVDLPPNVLGAYNPSTKAIEIDPYRIRQARDSLGPESENLYSTETNEDVMGVVLHEVQHAVQDLDPISPNLMSRAGDLTSGSNPEAFKSAKQRVPKYVLENKDFVDRFFGDNLYDPQENYLRSSGEVFARSTEDRRLQSLLERLQNSDPKKMLEDVGATQIATERRETPIGQVTTRIWQAEQKGLISPGMEPEKLDSILKKILDDVGKQFEAEKVEKFRKGGEVPIPRTVDDHFLSYINPQEASALRAMGGGITASGGQRMMNGIPSFRPSDNAAEANATNDPDDVADPHGVGQPTSASPFGGVPGVDQATSEVDARARANMRERERKAAPRSLEETLDHVSFMAQVEKEQRERDREREKAEREKAKAKREKDPFSLSVRVGVPGFSVPADLGLPGFFGGLASEPSDPSDDPSQAESNLQKGGEVKVPEKVSGHFLAYINPQEAAMLRGAGGGITALGGQKMRNGIPTFDNPQDDEGQGGAPPTDTTDSEAAAAEAAAAAAGPSSAPSLGNPDFVGLTDPVSGIVGLVTDPFGTLGKLSGIPDAVVNAAKAASAVGTIAGSLMSMPAFGPIGPMMAMNSLVGLARDYGLDVDDDTSNPDTEGMFGQ
jgi:hypothetical protein